MTINFIYHNQEYPIKLKYLNKETDYFSNTKIVDENSKIDFNLIDEFENTDYFSTEIITNFIKYFKTGELELTPNNILCMRFLISKYRITKLEEKSHQYIKQNYKQLINNTLNNYQNQQKMGKEVEKLLSKHIIEYLNDDRLLLLPTHILYRIFDECFTEKQTKKGKQNKNIQSNLQTKSSQKFKETDDNDNDNDDKEEEEESKNIQETIENKTIKAKQSKSKTKKSPKKSPLKRKVQKTTNKKKSKIVKTEKDYFPIIFSNYYKNVIDFLFKLIKQRGNEALILFDLIKLDQKGDEYFNEKLSTEDFGDLVDFKQFFKRIISHLKSKNDEMKSKFNEQLKIHEGEMNDLKSEINQMKENYEEIIAQNYSEMKNVISSMSQMIEKMQIEHSQQIEELNNKIEENQNKFNQEKMELKNEINKDILIQNIINNHLFNISSNSNNFLDLITFLFKINNQNKKRINIFNSIYVENKPFKIQDIIIQCEFDDEVIDEVGFHSNVVEMLFNSNSFDNEDFKNILSNFSMVYFEIETSSPNFDSIFRLISTYKKITMD